MAESNNSKSTNSIIVSVLFRLAIKYPELAIIISVMLLLLLPLTVISQATDGGGFTYFSMFFLYSVVAMGVVYTAKGFIAAIALSPVLKVVSSWCVGFAVLSITVSLGVSVSALLLSQIFPKLQNGLLSEVSRFAVSFLVRREDPTPDESSPAVFDKGQEYETHPAVEMPAVPRSEDEAREISRSFANPENGYQDCLGEGKTESEIYSCIDNFK